MKINELYSDVLSEDRRFEFKSALNPEKPIKWAKTLVAFANGDGGVLFVGVTDDREAFGLSLSEIDKAKNLVARVNDRYIYPHVKVNYMLRSVDSEAEKFVLAIKVQPAESVVRYREGDFNETVYIKGDGNAMPASPEDIISLAKRKSGVDNETSGVLYREELWTTYLKLCAQFRHASDIPTVKELQNEEIVSKDGYAKSGFLMFKDDYSNDDTLICCRLWKGKNKAGMVLDSARIKGSISKTLLDAFAFIERNTKTGWEKVENGGRREVRSYPKEAVREAMVNAIAHRDYSINGTQIDVDIFDDRIDIVSPGSWLLPKDYDQYPVGSIPSIRRNTIIAACLDVANLMERGGTGFQTIVEAYRDARGEKQPGVLIYPGILDLRLYDLLYNEDINVEMMDISDQERIIELLKSGPKSVKNLQSTTEYRSRSQFLTEVINPLLEKGLIYRDGSAKSPTALMHLSE